jgi:WD40 repeat protein
MIFFLLVFFTKNQVCIYKRNQEDGINKNQFSLKNRFPKHESLLWVAHFVDGGKNVVSASYDSRYEKRRKIFIVFRILYWNAETGDELLNIPDAHTKGIWELQKREVKSSPEAASFQTSDSLLYSVGNDGFLKCWDIEKKVPCFTVQGSYFLFRVFFFEKKN